ncbi:CBS domain-containing protein [Amycolatopsis tucumanensis]|uniref:CBS domain-containing protein n=1 Tax=Amycolatopsis tucumanensis TaxID=401106 RepID=UPI003D75B79F
MRARDIMSTPAVTVEPGTPVKSAEWLMAQRGFTALPVIEEDRLAGIVTESDFVADRFRGEGTKVARRVGEVMTTDVVTVGPETDVTEVGRMMAGRGIRAVPVVDGNRIVGVITARDLVRVLARPDALLEHDIRARLAVLGRADRWYVDVKDGRALILDSEGGQRDDEIAAALAEGVPGVIEARCYAGDVEHFDAVERVPRA